MKKILTKILEFLLFKISDKKILYVDNANNNAPKRYNRVKVSDIQIKTKQVVNKIPKHIFYFYVGDKIPDYCKYSIESIKNVVSNYTIEVLDYNWDTYFKNNDIWNIIVQNKLDHIKNFSPDQISYISYIYKRQMLQKYGGIFCDCSVFAIRNFDELLSNDCFTLTKRVNNKIVIDECFFGSIKGETVLPVTKIYPPIDYDIKDYSTLKFSFYSGNLQRINTHHQLLQPYIYNFI